MIEIERAALGTRHVAISVPFIVVRIFFPLIKVTSALIFIESPPKAISGANPVTAKIIGERIGVGVLQRKSFRPLMVTLEDIAATTGSSDLIRTAKALADKLGFMVKAVTEPADIFRESKPTGTNFPSADKSSSVKIASESAGARIRRVCDPAAF
jgi:hypothetical protein